MTGPGRGIAVSHKQIYPANQRFELAMGAVPNPDRGEVIEAAAGERIVAFARPGKPSGSPVFNGGLDAFSPGKQPRHSASGNGF
jgi:hypothetical protein